MSTTTPDTQPPVITGEPDKHVKETVRYDFTDSEITQIAREQGQKMRDRATLEEEKKRVAKQYGVRIDTIDGEIEADTDKITSGYEMRSVECAVFYDRPDKGFKSIVRTDNGKVIREERMTQMECQVNLDLKEGEDAEDGEGKLEAVSEKGAEAIGEGTKAEEPEMEEPVKFETETETTDAEPEAEAKANVDEADQFKPLSEPGAIEGIPVGEIKCFRTNDGDLFDGRVMKSEWTEALEIVRESDKATIQLTSVEAYRDIIEKEGK